MRKLILFAFLALAVLITACSINTANSAGVVNGTPIPYSEFMDSYRSHYENFYTENGRPPDTEERKALEQTTWLNITKFIILKDYYDKYNIKVSHQEVIDTLMANPPDYVRNSPWFKVNNTFDIRAYQQSLNYDSPYNLRPVRKHYYDNVIPIMKLKEKLIDHEFLTRSERRSINQILGARADIDWLIFDSNSQNIRISDLDIEAYYNANLQSYLREPFYTLRYAKIEAIPSDTDIAYTEAVRDSIMSLLREGQSFEVITRGDAASRAGITISDMGFLFIPDLDREIKAAVLELAPGAFSVPIQTSESIDVYRMEQLTRSMVKLTKLSMPIKAREASITASRRLAQNLKELSTLVGFERACDEMDLPICDVSRVSPESIWLEDEEALSSINTQLESVNRPGILEPVYSRKFSSWIVVDLMQKQAREPKPLAEVRDQINQILIHTQKLDLTKQQARIWLDQSAPAYQLNPGDTRYQLTPMRGQSINDPVSGLDLHLLYYKALRAQQRKESPAFYILDDLIVIPIVRRVEYPRSYNADPVIMRRLYVESLSEDWFNNWINQKVAAARVRIIPMNR